VASPPTTTTPSNLAGAGSRVTLTADVHTRGAWTLAGPMIRAAIRRTDTGQLDALDRELAAR
jgi:hypothetical protein